MKKTTTKKRVTRKAASKKRRSNKAPSAKQLAARAKFAAAAKARSKKAKAKKAPARKPNKTIIKARTIQHLDVSKIHNGKRTRRKYRNGYLDLVIRGTAEKTTQGWKVGSKTIPQGKGIAPIRSGYYLDKATGMIFAKRARNSDHRDADHPIEVTKHWRQGPPGYLTQWQRAHHAGQQGLFDHGIKPAKKRNSSAKASPATRAIREKFTGTKSRKTATMNASNGTPKNLAKLGKLVLIKTANGIIKPGNGITWLCADAKGKLHLATSAARLVEGPARNFGEVSQIEYEARKPHLSYKNQTIFFHKMGEEGGKKPVLIADGKGGLKLRGGSYRIEREGIVD